MKRYQIYWDDYILDELGRPHYCKNAIVLALPPQAIVALDNGEMWSIAVLPPIAIDPAIMPEIDVEVEIIKLHGVRQFGKLRIVTSSVEAVKRYKEIEDERKRYNLGLTGPTAGDRGESV